MQTNCTRDLIVAIRYNAPGISSVDNHAALLSPRSTVTSYNYTANGIETKLS